MHNEQKTGLRVMTIGHSNHPLGHFIELLKQRQVEVVVDTRSYPYSNYATHYDQQPLKEALIKSGFQYIYLGEELGGRPDGSQYYDADGHVLYGKVADSAAFKQGLQRLENGIAKYEVAMLCAEENPAACHHRLLIGKVLLDHGIAVDHIRGDGRLQSESELAQEASPPEDQMDLFQKTEAPEWKSIPSVSRKKLQNSSSAF
jgi:uncharacterized protein (DUF488 family)